MKYSIAVVAVLSALALSACERAVIVPSTVVAVPGPAGPAGATGATGATAEKGAAGATGATGADGEKGDKGKTGGDTIIVVPPPAPTR